jgi:hypothetical protein
MRMELSKRAETAYSYAQEVSKQLITLSTAVFALTLTFAEKIEQPGSGARAWLEIAWGFYLASVLFGTLTLMALAGHVAEPPVETDSEGNESARDTIYTPGIRLVAGLQIALFLAALVLTLVYGAKAT